MNPMYDNERPQYGQPLNPTCEHGDCQHESIGSCTHNNCLVGFRGCGKRFCSKHQKEYEMNKSHNTSKNITNLCVDCHSKLWWRNFILIGGVAFIALIIVSVSGGALSG